MATSCFLYFFSFIVLVNSAFLPSQDVQIPRNRLTRSPHCWSCEQEYGSSGYGGYHHQPHFHSQQWSGLSRSPDGNQQQVFSGAAASAEGGTQASSEAFSLASAGSEAQRKGDQQQKQTAINSENGKYGAQETNVQESQNKKGIGSDYQQQQQSHDDLTNGKDSSQQLQQQSLSSQGSNSKLVSTDEYLQQQQLGSSSNGNGQYRNHQILNSPNNEKNYAVEHGQYSALTQNSGRGDIEDNTEKSRKYFGRQYNNGNGQQELQHNQGDVISDNTGRHPESYRASGMQYNQGPVLLGNSARRNDNYDKSGLSQFRSESESLNNNDNQQRLYDTRYFGNEQQRYNKGKSLQYDTQKYNNNADSEQLELDQSNSHQQTKYGGFESSAQTPLSNNKYTNTKLSGQERAVGAVQQEVSSPKDSSYHDTQSSLNGALSLASQGVQASQKLPESSCTNCDGKGSLAYSNAKSNSGSAVALSIGG